MYPSFAEMVQHGISPIERRQMVWCWFGPKETLHERFPFSFRPNSFTSQSLKLSGSEDAWNSGLVRNGRLQNTPSLRVLHWHAVRFRWTYSRILWLARNPGTTLRLCPEGKERYVHGSESRDAAAFWLVLDHHASPIHWRTRSLPPVFRTAQVSSQPQQLRPVLACAPYSSRCESSPPPVDRPCQRGMSEWPRVKLRDRQRRFCLCATTPGQQSRCTGCSRRTQKWGSPHLPPCPGAPTPCPPAPDQSAARQRQARTRQNPQLRRRVPILLEALRPSPRYQGDRKRDRVGVKNRRGVKATRGEPWRRLSSTAALPSAATVRFPAHPFLFLSLFFPFFSGATICASRSPATDIFWWWPLALSCVCVCRWARSPQGSHGRRSQLRQRYTCYVLLTTQIDRLIPCEVKFGPFMLRCLISPNLFWIRRLKPPNKIATPFISKCLLTFTF
jgi:hypothetical protein